MSLGFHYHSTFDQVLKQTAFLELQTWIDDKLQHNQPFFIARMSGIESADVGRFLKGNFKDIRIDEIQEHSGILFTNAESFLEYVNMTLEAISECDRLAIWDGGCYQQCQEMYDYLQQEFPHIYTIPAHVLEPYYFMQLPEYKFPELFKNKKILIITSHADSVRHQIHQLDKIFFPHLLFSPSQHFQVYKTVQQNGKSCDGQDWRVHYQKMCQDLHQIDFDVAFIGCGGFSNPLGVYILSKLQKSAIYVGGPIQLYFGILGMRWISNHKISEYYKRNSNNWICPMTSDYVSGCEMVDQACYWMPSMK